MTANSCGPSDDYKVGVMFLTGFRWLLLLLFALLIEKAAESVTVSFTETLPVYTSVTVFSPLFGDAKTPWHWLLRPNWRYLAGVMRLFVTLLFGAKYFLCLVDPIERVAKVVGLSPKSTDIRARVRTCVDDEVKGRHVALVALVTIPEFILLFHAATSVANYHQWLMFLLLLVLWDSLAFFGILELWGWLAVAAGRVGILYIKSVARFRKSLWERRAALWIKKIVSDGIHNGVGGEEISPKVQAVYQDLQNRRTDLEDKVKKRIAGLKGQRPPSRDYGPWNLLDAIVLIIGLSRDFVGERGAHASHLFVDKYDDVGLVVLVLLFAVLAVTLFRAHGLEKQRPLILLGLVLMLGSVLSCAFLPMARLGEDCANTSVLAALFVASLIFVRCNYLSQRQLWHLHVLMLGLDVP
jgi:hypothetical protein